MRFAEYVNRVSLVSLIIIAITSCLLAILAQARPLGTMYAVNFVAASVPTSVYFVLGKSLGKIIGFIVGSVLIGLWIIVWQGYGSSVIEFILPSQWLFIVSTGVVTLLFFSTAD